MIAVSLLETRLQGRPLLLPSVSHTRDATSVRYLIEPRCATGTSPSSARLRSSPSTTPSPSSRQSTPSSSVCPTCVPAPCHFLSSITCRCLHRLPLLPPCLGDPAPQAGWSWPRPQAPLDRGQEPEDLARLQRPHRRGGYCSPWPLHHRPQGYPQVRNFSRILRHRQI